MATEPQPVESGRNDRAEYDRYQLDRRLTIQETRFDTILPMLATKADLAELKAELVGQLGDTKAELVGQLGETKAVFLGQLGETKAELLGKLGETKAELKADMGRLSKWVASTFIVMVLGFAGMFVTMLSLLRH